MIVVVTVLFSFEQAGYAEEEKKLRLAVIGFSIKGQELNVPDLDTIIQEWLTTFLVQSGSFEVVERQELEKVLQEQSLGQTGILNAESASQVGQILGVNILITGTLIYFEDTFEINARLIDSTNGSISGVASVSTNDEDELRSKIKELAETIRRKLSKPPTIPDVKVYEPFDGEELNLDLWELGFDDRFKKTDKKKTTFALNNGVLSIQGKYKKNAESRIAWLAASSGETYYSIEAKIRVREVKGGVSVCLGANWDDENWSAICAYFAEDNGDIEVILEDTEKHETTFDFNVRVDQWYVVRLAYQEGRFQYYWNDKLIKSIAPASPISGLEDLNLDIGFAMEETKSMHIEVDEILLR